MVGKKEYSQNLLEQDLDIEKMLNKQINRKFTYKDRGKSNRSYKIQWIQYSILRRLFKK